MESRRLARLCDELESFQAEIEQLVARSPGALLKLDPVVLRRLSAALDHLRHVIWPVLVGVERQDAATVAYSLRFYRMERLREMLAHLQGQAKQDDSVKLFLVDIRRKLEQ